jgi:hypothetical protein
LIFICSFVRHVWLLETLMKDGKPATAIWEIDATESICRASVERMKVTFTKNEGRRYSIAFYRDHGPELVPRQAPGYDEHLPHDLAHFLVEKEFGLRLGVFGQLAAGGEGVFKASTNDRSARTRRSGRRIAEIGRADMARSERLVGLVQPLWELRSGRKPRTQPVVDTTLATPFEITAMMEQFDKVSARWQALSPGESITLEWPDELTFNAAGSAEGRRESRDRLTRRV